MAWNKLTDVNLRAIGFLLIALWIVTFFEEFPYFGSFNFLWLCKISFLLIALACLTKDGRYLIVFFSVAALPLVIWTFDFIILLTSNQSIGMTQFMFEYGQGKIQFFMNLLHLFLLPLALIISKNITFYKTAKKQIIIYGAIIASLSYFLSDVKEDINCVHNLCYPYPLEIDAGIALMIVFVYVLVCAWIIEQFVTKNLKKINSKIIKIVTIGLIVLGLFASIFATIKYIETPHYSCQSNQNISCERFYMDREKMIPFLKFKVSKLEENCFIQWYIDDQHYVKYKLDYEEVQFIYFPSFEQGNRKISSELECFSST